MCSGAHFFVVEKGSGLHRLLLKAPEMRHINSIRLFPYPKEQYRPKIQRFLESNSFYFK